MPFWMVSGVGRRMGVLHGNGDRLPNIVEFLTIGPVAFAQC